MTSQKTVKTVDFRNAKGVLSQRRAQGDDKPQVHLVVSQARITKTPIASPRPSPGRFSKPVYPVRFSKSPRLTAGEKNLRLSEIPGFEVDSKSIRASKRFSKIEQAPIQEEEEDEDFTPMLLTTQMSLRSLSLKMQGLTVSLLNSPKESFVGKAGPPNLAHICSPITKTIKPRPRAKSTGDADWTLATKRRGYGRAAKSNSLMAPGRQGRSRSFGKPKHNPGRDQTHVMASWRPAEGSPSPQPSPRGSRMSSRSTSRSRSPMRSIRNSLRTSRGSNRVSAPRFVNSKLGGKKQIGFSKKMTDSQKVNLHPRVAPKGSDSKSIDWEIKVDYPLQQAAPAAKKEVDIFGKKFGRCDNRDWRRR